jgi:hypothetical protein
MGKRRFIRSHSLTAFHKPELHIAGNISNPSIRVHIQLPSGKTMVSGKLLSKDEVTHKAIILSDVNKEVVHIDLSFYTARSSLLMPNTVTYRRVSL